MHETEYHIIFNMNENMLIVMFAFIDLNPFWQGVPFVSHEHTSKQKKKTTTIPKIFHQKDWIEPLPKGIVV